MDNFEWFIELIKEKRYDTIFGIIFWSTIFWLIGTLLIYFLPTYPQTLFFAYLIFYFISKSFINLIVKASRSIKVFGLTIFFLLSPILSFIGLGLFINGIKLNNGVKGSVYFITYIVGLSIPYLLILYYKMNSKYCTIIMGNLKNIKLGLSFSTAFITVIYAIEPIIGMDELYKNMIHMLIFVPFAINIFLICFIDYWLSRE